MGTHYVPECNVPDLVKKLAAMAKRAAKMGLEPPTWTVEPARLMVELVDRQEAEENAKAWTAYYLYQDTPADEWVGPALDMPPGPLLLSGGQKRTG